MTSTHTPVGVSLQSPERVEEHNQHNKVRSRASSVCCWRPSLQRQYSLPHPDQAVQQTRLVNFIIIIIRAACNKNKTNVFLLCRALTRLCF